MIVESRIVESVLKLYHPNVVKFVELKPESDPDFTFDYSKPKKGDVVLKLRMPICHNGKYGEVEYGINGKRIYYVMPRRWK